MGFILSLCASELKTFTTSEVSLEYYCEDARVGVIWEEPLTTSKLLCSTYLKIKGICSLKALKFKCLRRTLHIIMHF